MGARLRRSLLWGVVGALSFLVLVQGYDLLAADLGVGVVPKLSVSMAVGAVSTGATYVAEGYVLEPVSD
jgi:hypothetical protein